MPVRGFSREETWLLPPTLEELTPADHPARYVAAFVDALDRAAWLELGVAPDGAARGALAYHPRVLLGVWLYGFMTGVRSSRKLEGACRDQVPYLWLTGWRRPDHTTLWRFSQQHRQAMRTLLKQTVRTAVAAGLVDLAVQAVAGTRIAGSAANLAACAAQVPPVPVLMPDPQAPAATDAYHKDRFVYDPDTDTFTCPQGATLRFNGQDRRRDGAPIVRRYRAHKAVCDACPVRAACTTSTTKGRAITRSPDDATPRTHRTRVATAAARAAYRRRKTLPEPAFGILTEQQAARRFLLRGLEHVRAEWSSLATAFNLRTLARRWRAAVRPAPATLLRSRRLAAA